MNFILQEKEHLFTKLANKEINGPIETLLKKRKKIKKLGFKNKNDCKEIITLKKGKWDREEHNRFLEICLKHGNNWPKVNYF